MSGYRFAARLGGLVACGLLAACAAPQKDRPAAKPDTLSVHATDRHGQLTQARISTKSGQLLILEPDGSLTQMQVDSDAGRDAFAVTDADLAGLDINLSLDLSGMPMSVPASMGLAAHRVTAQDRALQAFAARMQPMLPDVPAGLPAESFMGARIQVLGADQPDQPGQAGRNTDAQPVGDMVSVTANLVAGLDVDVAFAYATCALAGWAEANQADYARHVRTLTDKGAGRVRIESVFTLSTGSQPMGLRVMRTGETLQACADRGIPRA